MNATTLAHVFTDFLKSLNTEQKLAVEEKLDTLKPSDGSWETENQPVIKAKTGAYSRSSTNWAKHIDVIYEILFPNLEYSSNLLPAYHLTTSGKQVNMAFFHTKLPCAHAANSKHVKVNGVDSIRDYAGGTLQRTMEDRFEKAWSKMTPETENKYLKSAFITALLVKPPDIKPGAPA